MSNEQLQNNTPTFTPPASVTSGTNTPAIGTTDVELDAMYGKSPTETPKPSDKPADNKEVPTDDKKTEADKKADDAVGGYKNDAAKDAAGYNEPKDKQDAKNDKADADSKEAPKIEFDKTGHSEDAVKMIESFAEANKLNKEQTDAYAGFVKSLQEAQAQAKINAENEAKAAFQRDFDTLKNDKDFGGENLDTSFKQVGQVLDLMPEVKKHLTDTGTRLQPQIMLGLKRLHGKLFGQEGTIVQGGATKAADTQEPWNAFYS